MRGQAIHGVAVLDSKPKYAAQGDGTLVVEQWAPNPTGGTALVCTDESGEGFGGGKRAIVDKVLNSFEWVAGD